MNQNPKVKNPSAMLFLHGIVILVVLYMLWQVVSAYLQGGEGAPSLAVVIIGSLLLLGGCVFVGIMALRLYKQSKEAATEELQAQEKQPEDR